jgi:5-methylcytosine-specific restriction protein A
MPRAMRVCRTRDCIELTRSGLCDDCEQALRKSRPNSRERGYSTRWDSLSRAFLRRYPNCFDCGTKADVVDHIDGLGPTGPRGFDWSNLQSLCRACHGRKTVRHDGGFGRWAADGRRLHD